MYMYNRQLATVAIAILSGYIYNNVCRWTLYSNTVTNFNFYKINVALNCIVLECADNKAVF